MSTPTQDRSSATSRSIPTTPLHQDQSCQHIVTINKHIRPIAVQVRTQALAIRIPTDTDIPDTTPWTPIPIATTNIRVCGWANCHKCNKHITTCMNGQRRHAIERAEHRVFLCRTRTCSLNYIIMHDQTGAQAPISPTHHSPGEIHHMSQPQQDHICPECNHPTTMGRLACNIRPDNNSCTMCGTIPYSHGLQCNQCTHIIAAKIIHQLQQQHHQHYSGQQNTNTTTTNWRNHWTTPTQNSSQHYTLAGAPRRWRPSPPPLAPHHQ
jgi:hypothetical protein